VIKIDEKIRFGLVGCGMISVKHADAIKMFPDAELVAVCDIIKERAEDLAQKYDCKSYQDFDEMLKDDSIGVITIATPSGFHADMSIKALQAKKHVLCEKPMALSTKDTQRVIDAETESGKKFLLIKQNKYNPPIVALKDVVYNNKLGDLIMINSNVYWNRNPEYYASAEWRGTKDLDGGSLFTLASHFLDLMIWVGGNVTSVTSVMKNFNHPQIETEDAAIAILKFDNGAIGKILITTCVLPKNIEGNLYVLGTKGTIKVGGKYLNELEHWHVEGMEQPELEPSAPPNDYGTYQGTMSNHDKVYRNVLDVLLKGEEIKTNSLQGQESVKVIEAIYKSAETGKEVFLNENE
jgi:UDP-N-acetyl-2-amino-2-deoxyglucuronate dehydrogenase